jgi:hypothetical protein
MELEFLQPRHKSKISVRKDDNIVLMLGIEDLDRSSRIEILVDNRHLALAAPDTDGLCGPEDFCSLSLLIPSRTLGTGQLEIEALAVKKNEEVIATAAISIMVTLNTASTSCRCMVNDCSCQYQYEDLVHNRSFKCDKVMNCSLV